MTPHKPIRPGDPAWPVAWATYVTTKSLEEDILDLKAHGIGLISVYAGDFAHRNNSTKYVDVAEARRYLDLARRHGMKLQISFPEATEQAELVRETGLEPAHALLIGGVYEGRAIDRHLFRFTAGLQRILIEPPVYNRGFAYRLGADGGADPGGEPMGHYFLDMTAPERAEVVVPLRAFDGEQHLRVVSVAIMPAPPGARPAVDSVTPDLPASRETRDRTLYELSFDLTGMDDALLDRIGVAVYWPYHGSSKYWMFGRGGIVGAAAESTRETLRRNVRRILQTWIDANGGVFPLDVVIAGRYGDECFYPTGQAGRGGAAVSFPLWDYSAPQIRAFRERAGEIAHPRTWGYPEVYGPASYGWWLYALHKQTAGLAGVIREEIARLAPGLLLFRNTTRGGVFSQSNDKDGSGPELLTRNLDLVHIDPYPVHNGVYQPGGIPRDMGYYAGLARRYDKPLMPWVQAFVNLMITGPQHLTPDQIDRMIAQHERHGVDAIMWMGYGSSRDAFPTTAPASWDHTTAIHRRLAAHPPPKPRAKLAVLRWYTTWAVCDTLEGLCRNPTDWLLQQLLEVWSVGHDQPYDVFELPPALSDAEHADLAAALAAYPYVVSTEPWDGAWVIDDGGRREIETSEAEAIRARFEAELTARGWLDGQEAGPQRAEATRA